MRDLVQPPVDPHVLAPGPRTLHGVRLGHIRDLHADVLLDELLHGEPGLGQGSERRKPACEGRVGVQGGLCGAGGGVARGGAPALGVPDDDHVSDADVVDGVAQDGEDVVVCGVELAGCGAQMRARARGEEKAGRGTYFATLRCTKMSPGLTAVMTDSGTRESAQPIQRTCGSIV